MSNLLVSLDEAASELGVGQTTLFKLLSSGELKGVKIGRRRLIPRAELEAYVQALVASGSTTPAA